MSQRSRAVGRNEFGKTEAEDVVIMDGGAFVGVENRWSAAIAAMERGIQSGLVPGAVIAVGSATETHFVHAAGLSQVEPKKVAMPENAIFDLASLTKVIATTTGILLLVEQGRLSLDQTLIDVYPDWRGTVKQNITVRHLLTHTSGLPAWHPLYVWGKGKANTLDTIGRLNLHGAPGERVEYSCLGYIVLGHIAETVTGKGLDEFFAEEIGGPLGMTSSTYLPLERLPEVEHVRLVPTERGNTSENAKLRFAGQLYPDMRRGFYPGEVHDGNAWYSLGGISGNAGLFGTAEDVLRFGQMWLRARFGAKGELLSSATAALSATNHTPDAADPRGLGWQLQWPPAARMHNWHPVPGVQYGNVTVPDTPWPRSCGELFGADSVGHTGFTGTSLWIDPDADLVVSLMTNRVHPELSDGIFQFRARVHNAVAAAVSRG